VIKISVAANDENCENYKEAKEWKKEFNELIMQNSAKSNSESK
jgi:hypothetical protein